ncbi:DWNN-domain-containing protein [Ceraceosorus guamensis]|uniref:DWNN-domain-containing protein n=1 Tax=Ceraceosorus guamensis TaxID=1522189 RepID=A0A316WBH2_9BASI|nr:DWNN-domain-containing protein [Ceraceosorus guamensis]PWN45273.1 DWNN-domain-containing protein [Ceraceosorus guamensis]
MASASIYYKFKSARAPSRITFDGVGMSVWDLKREIMLQNRMGKGTDFDLVIASTETDEEYKDDVILPRATSVLAKRVPPARAGKGTAAQYVADVAAGPSAAPGQGGRDDRFSQPNASGVASKPIRGVGGMLSKRFDGKDDKSTSEDPTVGGGSSLGVLAEGGDEEARNIAAMFQASTEAWDETQERMQHATYRERGGAPRRGGPPRAFTSANSSHIAGPDRPPPIGYICFRCGTKGHWIHDCPTNNDREWDNKPRFKRTTGIPRSMLRKVEVPEGASAAEGGAVPMVTADGDYVIAQVDNATWERARAQRKPLGRSDVFSSVPQDASLACPICSKLLKRAVKTPCCSTRYCEDCIQTYLLEHDFACAECDRRIADLTRLAADDEKREAVEAYVAAQLAKSESERAEGVNALENLPQAQVAELKAARSNKTGASASARDEAGVEAAEVPEANAAESTTEETKEGSEEKVKEQVSENAHGADDAEKARSINDSPPREDVVALEEPEPVKDIIPTTAQWNPRPVQQTLMMLTNAALPPPMRMQLQMQLQLLQMHFMKILKGGGEAQSQTQQLQQHMPNQNIMGMNMNQMRANGFPPGFAANNGMSMGFGAMMGMNGMNNPQAMQQMQSMGMGVGMHMGNMNHMAFNHPAMRMHTGMGMPMGMGNVQGNVGNLWQANQMQQQQHAQQGYAQQPIGGAGSAYMRAPVNGNDAGRQSGNKRERPMDFHELGGGGVGGPGPDSKQARME